jgi:hypothetical protein
MFVGTVLLDVSVILFRVNFRWYCFVGVVCVILFRLFFYFFFCRWFNSDLIVWDFVGTLWGLLDFAGIFAGLLVAGTFASLVLQILQDLS